MRFIELRNGDVLLAPRRATSHLDMLRMARKGSKFVASAGFLPARYEPDESWTPYGKSTGLDIEAWNKDLKIPLELFVAKHRYGLLFSNNSELLEGLDDITQAQWGMTEASYWGDVLPVYSPLHPSHKVTADAVICD